MRWAIWRSMGYSADDIGDVVSWKLSTLAPYLTTWSNNYAEDATWPKTGNYTGGVQIMSLATALNISGAPKSGSLVQDQLIWTPAPEPGALLVWAGLMAAAAVVYKRPKA
jgi:hypothetical protein